MAAAVGIPEFEVKVNRVRIEGLKKTKTDIAVEQIKDVLKVKNSVELFIKSYEAAERLQKLNIFKYVNVKLDVDKREREKRKVERGLEGEGEGVNKGTKEDGLEVTFMVKESGRFKGRVGAETGTQSGGASLSLVLKNLFGRAEQLQLRSSTSLPHWGHSLELQFTKPYYKDLSKLLILSAGATENKVPVSGYQEYITGSTAKILFFSFLGFHDLSFDYNCRQLYGFTHNVPMTIREDAGYSLKSSIKHILDWDNRNDPDLPTNGYRIKMTHELAGLGGDVHFSKGEMMSEHLLELYRNWVLSFTLWGGYLYPFTRSKINDRFLLGGASTLRGFGMWGVGPRKNGFSLGGEAYWASGLHLYAPLPLVSDRGFFRRIRCHGFATAGNVLRTSPNSFSASTVRSLTSNIRLSLGVGLHFKLRGAQIEFNYAFPIKAHHNDHLQPGFQFGIGLDML